VLTSIFRPELRWRWLQLLCPKELVIEPKSQSSRVK
jgi:hypothetical protein